MIGGLVLFLIFSPQLTKSSDLKTKNSEAEQPNKPNDSTGDNQDNDQNNKEEKEEIFATKIKLNCEDDITISIGSSVELLSGFINVEPTKYLSEMTTSLSVESGATNGIEFSNNKITAYAVGRYRIEFIVPKTATTQIYDVLSVRVVEKENDDKVKFVNNNFTNDTTISLSEMVEIDELYQDYSILNNDHITYSNNKITFKNTGSSSLNLTLNSNYIAYNYSFDFSVKPKVTSEIYITGENNGVLEVEPNKIGCFDINYEIKLSSGEHIEQDIKVEFEQGGVIEIVGEITAPVITFRVITKASVKIRIIPTKVDVEPKEILIVIK